LLEFSHSIASAESAIPACGAYAGADIPKGIPAAPFPTISIQSRRYSKRGDRTVKALSRLAISDEGFIFDPVNGDSFLTNPAGVFILKRMREASASGSVLADGALAHALETEFEIDADSAAGDVADFVGQLTTLNLL